MDDLIWFIYNPGAYLVLLLILAVLGSSLGEKVIRTDAHDGLGLFQFLSYAAIPLFLTPYLAEGGAFVCIGLFDCRNDVVVLGSIFSKPTVLVWMGDHPTSPRIEQTADLWAIGVVRVIGAVAVFNLAITSGFREAFRKDRKVYFSDPLPIGGINEEKYQKYRKMRAGFFFSPLNDGFVWVQAVVFFACFVAYAVDAVF